MDRAVKVEDISVTRLIHFNYGIGDRVFLNELPIRYRSYDCYKYDFVPTEYTINGLGFTVDEKGIHTYYRLHAYCDKYLTYHNRITDDLIEPTSSGHFEHDEEIDFSDANGEELKVGDNMLANVVKIYDGEQKISHDFVFSGEGPIVRMEWMKEGRRTISGEYDISNGFVNVFYERHFLCTRKNGESYTDARKYGNISSDPTICCIKRLPEDYVEKYVKQCTRLRFDPREVDEYDTHDQWLEHFGVYEEVKNLYEQRKNENNKTKKAAKKSTSKTKSVSKLDKIVEGLSEKEKEELLKILNK